MDDRSDLRVVTAPATVKTKYDFLVEYHRVKIGDSVHGNQRQVKEMKMVEDSGFW
jgi:hypothetical protein